MSEYKVYNATELLSVFPFGRTKLFQLLRAGTLPVVKIGRDYLTSKPIIDRWLEEHLGETIDV